MKKLKVFISGQKFFGRQVFELCNQLSFIEIVGVCAPSKDKYVAKVAGDMGVNHIPSGKLSDVTMPNGIDLGITAHSFDYIGDKLLRNAKYGWLGYHPSLLPRHRGRSSIEWAIKMRDSITGGTLFWLDSGIDTGDIAYQDFCFISPELYAMDSKNAAKRLWEQSLQNIGLRLFEKALTDIYNGVVIRNSQSEKVATYEPGI